jgi:hypothetical protein
MRAEAYKLATTTTADDCQPERHPAPVSPRETIPPSWPPITGIISFQPAGQLSTVLNCPPPFRPAGRPLHQFEMTLGGRRCCYRSHFDTSLICRHHRVTPLVRIRSQNDHHDPDSSLLRGPSGPVGGHASMPGREVNLLSSHAGRSGAPDGRQNTQQATQTAGTVMQNQPAGQARSMTLSRYALRVGRWDCRLPSLPCHKRQDDS